MDAPPPAPPPPDDHVHTEWSHDAPDGSMERTCERALAVGLPAVAFTDHADWTDWSDVDGALDVEGYLACLERCRARFPGLAIRGGVELGEPHRFPDRVAALLAAGRFDRVLGSVHALPVGGSLVEVSELLGAGDPLGVVRAYLAELLVLVEGSAAFEVLAHAGYPLRSWPAAAAPFDVLAVEGELRAVLGALAASGRVLELNTCGPPLGARVVRWWREAGGAAVSFGSDAHEPPLVGRGFARAAAMAAAGGFGPGRDPLDLWRAAR